MIDWWTKFEGKEQESCIQGRRVTKSLANAGRSTSVMSKGRHTGQTVEETVLPRRQANKS